MDIMFIVLCSDISLVLRTPEISLHKTIHMISKGDPPFTCSCYKVTKMAAICCTFSCSKSERVLSLKIKNLKYEV